MTFLDEISKDKQAVTLYKYNGNDIKVDSNLVEEKIDKKSDLIRICFVDLETTGTHKKNDFIIEIALKVIQINKYSGEQLKAIDAYESFQDPGVPIPKEASLINGITDEMVKDHEINWNRVNEILDISQLCVAHNASFDRAFLDRYSDNSKSKIWACSINDINWFEKGFTNFKLELLSHWHGFYYDSHRAMNDVNAMIHLVVHPHYAKDKPIIELINNARKFQSRMIVKFNYNEKLVSLIKSKRYMFNGSTKEWSKLIPEDELDNEKEWLASNIYDGIFSGLFEQVNLIDKYKDR